MGCGDKGGEPEGLFMQLQGLKDVSNGVRDLRNSAMTCGALRGLLTARGTWSAAETLGNSKITSRPLILDYLIVLKSVCLSQGRGAPR